MTPMSDPRDPPGFYNDPAETLAEAWRLITRGVADRRSPFHTPTVATIGLDGAPSLRTVVLRHCNAAGRRLRFHTDRRSQKVSELALDPRISIHFYDPTAKIQLRVAGRALVHVEGPVAESAWAASRPFSRACYAVNPGPGAALEGPGDYDLPTDPALYDAGRIQFCAVETHIASIEWLYLANAGHRRARFAWKGTAVQAEWLVP
jgi:pyridoxamine 5'-phosphate oxidase